MKDIISMVAQCQLNSNDEQTIRKDFCNKLLEEFKMMKGEEFEPHLEKAIFNKKTGKTIIVLSF